MSDTMLSMELVLADLLYPNQLEEGDLIKIGEDFVTIESIVENDEGVNLVVTNDFDEEVELFLFDDEQVELYVFVE